MHPCPKTLPCCAYCFVLKNKTAIYAFGMRKRLWERSTSLAGSLFPCLAKPLCFALYTSCTTFSLEWRFNGEPLTGRYDGWQRPCAFTLLAQPVTTVSLCFSCFVFPCREKKRERELSWRNVIDLELSSVTHPRFDKVHVGGIPKSSGDASGFLLLSTYTLGRALNDNALFWNEIECTVIVWMCSPPDLQCCSCFVLCLSNPVLWNVVVVKGENEYALLHECGKDPEMNDIIMPPCIALEKFAWEWNPNCL